MRFWHTRDPTGHLAELGVQPTKSSDHLNQLKNTSGIQHKSAKEACSLRTCIEGKLGSYGGSDVLVGAFQRQRQQWLQVSARPASTFCCF